MGRKVICNSAMCMKRPHSFSGLIRDLLLSTSSQLPALSLDTDKVNGYPEQQKLSFEQDEDDSEHHSSGHSSAQLTLAQDSRDSPQGLLDPKSEGSSAGKRWPKPSCLLI